MRIKEKTSFKEHSGSFIRACMSSIRWRPLWKSTAVFRGIYSASRNHSKFSEKCFPFKPPGGADRILSPSNSFRNMSYIYIQLWKYILVGITFSFCLSKHMALIVDIILQISCLLSVSNYVVPLITITPWVWISVSS